RKADRTIVTRDASASVLTPAQVQELADLAVAVENEYAAPQDIEWCHDGTRFWIVQSRPITTTATGTDIEWTRANLAEVLPDLTSPQALDAVEQMLNAAERRYMGRLVASYSELGPM